jgi:hypothetical protein
LVSHCDFVCCSADAAPNQRSNNFSDKCAHELTNVQDFQTDHVSYDETTHTEPSATHAEPSARTDATYSEGRRVLLAWYWSAEASSAKAEETNSSADAGSDRMPHTGTNAESHFAPDCAAVTYCDHEAAQTTRGFWLYVASQAAEAGHNAGKRSDTQDRS